MPEPTRRVRSRISRDFGEDAPGVHARLTALPPEAYGGQDPERMQAALVLWAEGDLDRLDRQLELLRIDWRDVLMMGGLGHVGFDARMDEWLGPADG